MEGFGPVGAVGASRVPFCPVFSTNGSDLDHSTGLAPVDPISGVSGPSQGPPQTVSLRVLTHFGNTLWSENGQKPVSRNG